jgi:hypothetical protein
MNPCPSARPGEGEQEENRRGDRPVYSEPRQSGGSADRRIPILFLLGVPGQSPRSPDQTNKLPRSGAVHAATTVTHKAETPTRRLRPLYG